MITREADYAIRVALSLASIPKGRTLSTTALSEQMHIPYRFLRRIVRRLCASGIVGSVRGKEGGIYLLKKPAKISVFDIIAVFDPKSLLLNRCYEEDNGCPRRRKCSVHRMLGPVQDLLHEKLKSMNFADLSEK